MNENTALSQVSKGLWGPEAVVSVPRFQVLYAALDGEEIGVAMAQALPSRCALIAFDLGGEALPAEAPLGRLLRFGSRYALNKRGELAFTNVRAKDSQQLLAFLHHRIGIPLPPEALCSESLPGELARYSTRATVEYLAPRNLETSARRRRHFEAVAARDGAGCAWCGRPLRLGRGLTTFDHIIPKSESGYYAPWNLLLACATCNGDRSNRTVEEYAAVCRRHGYGLNEVAIKSAIRRRDSFRALKQIYAPYPIALAADDIAAHLERD